MVELFSEETYLVEFTASADEPRSINVALQRDRGDYATYGGKTFTISTDPILYQFHFRMTTDTDSVARFVMELGTSDIDIKIDNITLIHQEK